MKIAIIGAGSIGFTRGIVRDLMCVPELRDEIEFAFTDISARNLDMVYKLCKRDLAANGVKSTVSATTNRRAAFKNADYVFAVVRVGGLDAFKLDVDIPLKYGIDQCVGDTICAGGLMYAQRTIPVMLDFCADIAEVAKPNCKFITHVNPMAMNTWACTKYGYGVPTVGLCHGVPHGARQIAEVLGVPAKELDYICAGINHQTWFVQVRHKGRDMTGKILAGFEKHPKFRKAEKVRIDMLRRFGYYSTESNGHLSEYVPWYRKRPEEINTWIDLSSWINGETGGYLRVCTEGRTWFQTDFPNWMKAPPMQYRNEDRGGEHGSYIVESIATGRLYRGHFNVQNQGAITNLPDDAIVEVPGYVDGNGLNIPRVGDLPLGCAAVCNSSIQVQRMGMEAAVHGDIDLLRQAMMMDPLTGAVCNPPEIWQLVDEMLVAQAQWLPQYKRAIAAAQKRLASGPRLKTRTSKGAARIQIRSVKEMAKDAERTRRLAQASEKSGLDEGQKKKKA
jgi:alpha-galactosidase